MRTSSFLGWLTSLTISSLHSTCDVFRKPSYTDPSWSRSQEKRNAARVVAVGSARWIDDFEICPTLNPNTGRRDLLLRIEAS